MGTVLVMNPYTPTRMFKAIVLYTLVIFSSLVQKDLPFVMGAMTRVKARWRNIGLQWGIDNATLADIDTENHTNDSRFIAMIVEWLSNP